MVKLCSRIYFQIFANLADERWFLKSYEALEVNPSVDKLRSSESFESNDLINWQKHLWILSIDIELSFIEILMKTVTETAIVTVSEFRLTTASSDQLWICKVTPRRFLAYYKFYASIPNRFLEIFNEPQNITRVKRNGVKVEERAMAFQPKRRSPRVISDP